MAIVQRGESTPAFEQCSHMGGIPMKNLALRKELYFELGNGEDRRLEI